MKKRLDFLSDTVTLPTEEMRKAMATAEVGDDGRLLTDGRGEDPTVRQLEDFGAQKLGKERGLYVSSGTMGNLVSLLTHCERGELVVLEPNSHVLKAEGAAFMKKMGGLKPVFVDGVLGSIRPDSLKRTLEEIKQTNGEAKLLCIENTNNHYGGTCLTPQQTSEMVGIAKTYGLRVHLDGARIFNAAVALKVDPRVLTEGIDSVSFCLSKGLSAPVGSLLVGNEAFIKKAREVRKLIGGGMRQAGIIAAAGIVALKTMIDRLEEDHQKARLLAEGIVTHTPIRVDMKTVQTNIVVADITPLGISMGKVLAKLLEKDIRVGAKGPNILRFVTHKDLSLQDIRDTVVILGKLYPIK